MPTLTRLQHILKAIPGIAGPEGGSEENPVGTVFIALASPKGTASKKYQFSGDRNQIKTISAYTGIDWVRRYFLNLITSFQQPASSDPQKQ